MGFCCCNFFCGENKQILSISKTQAERILNRTEWLGEKTDVPFVQAISSSREIALTKHLSLSHNSPLCDTRLLQHPAVCFKMKQADEEQFQSSFFVNSVFNAFSAYTTRYHVWRTNQK